jgi:hypothetical protein
MTNVYDEGTMILEFIYGFILIVNASIIGVSLVVLTRFLRETSSIADHSSLERFKSVARLEMYAALVTIALLIPSVALALLLTLLRGLPALAVVLVSNCALWGISSYHKSVEVKARSLAVTDALAPEYQRVSQSWVKKAIPDF